MTTTKYRTGMKMSLDEFLSLGKTDGKWELDDGVLYIMASGTRDHQFLILQFSRRLDDYLDGFEQSPAHFYHEMTTILSRELQRAPEPDIVIVREGRPGILEGRWVEGAPDIVVEILSTDRSRDLVRKRRIYAEAGVLEYWPVDPRNDTVIQLELRDGQYVERAVLGADDVLTTPLLPGLSIPLADIFHHRRRPPRDSE
ncbi:MAG: Uma2 family endonuclease [Chloroflexi bacterium]|nr:Uma2 family endonuclease [Chloroflexota bacterium]MYE39506.1 Uma2 family endonuclease [Chloroflexota bacterium]